MNLKDVRFAAEKKLLFAQYNMRESSSRVFTPSAESVSRKRRLGGQRSQARLKHGTGGQAMTDYIPREAAIARLTKVEVTNKLATMTDAKREIMEMPAADVAPVVHGRWIERTAPSVPRYFECSECGAHENKHTAFKGGYCWRCGARMDLEDKNND